MQKPRLTPAQKEAFAKICVQFDNMQELVRVVPIYPEDKQNSKGKKK